MPRPGGIGFVSDPQLLPRIRDFKNSNQYLDAEDIASGLKGKYPEYNRKKFRDLVKLVRLGIERLEAAERNKTGLGSLSSINELDDRQISESKDGRKRKLHGSNSEPVITVESNNSDSEASSSFEYPKLNTANKSLLKLYGAKVGKSSTGPEHKRVKQGTSLSEKKEFGVNKLNVLVRRPSVNFSDLGGCEKQFLDVCRLSIQLKHPEVHRQLGVAPPRGLLLHGPPGCGKTLFAEAVAGELGLPFLSVASTELVAGISGESEEKIRSLFSLALENAPCILLLDEIDAIAPKRESTTREMEKRIVSQLISCLDDLYKPFAQRQEQKSLECDETDSVFHQLRHVLVIELLFSRAKEVPDTFFMLVIFDVGSVGTTSRPDSIESALRRAGRFDKEVALGIPDEKARTAILQIVCRGIRLEEDLNMVKLARLTPGYVGADLKALAREAAMCAVNRVLGTVVNSLNKQSKKSAEEVKEEVGKMLLWLKDTNPVEEDQLSSLFVTFADFENALEIVHPSAKREGFATVPDVTWSDIGALTEVREELLWSILARFLYPIKRPEDFEVIGLNNQPQGVLLCGPPGCGKTLLAKAVANETGMNFISVKGPELLSMYVGESERAVRTVFQRARDSSPCVIFFDEIDALCPKRSSNETSGSARLVNQLLTEMDGVNSRKQVFLIGATNRPDIVDPAILRPGRLDKILFVDFPDVADKADILEKLTLSRTRPHISPDVSFSEIASNPALEWFTGADLAALVHEASIIALKQRIADGNVNLMAVDKEHFLSAMQIVKPSVSEKDRKNYMHLKSLYGHCRK
ncbi:unnamed protein product [Enterobius vermicularis]|uniref:Nuclear valosin-containing protein-like n=1 Tax=Enterobius vermicularis TaxID=51028 RepID=A0A0N4VD28_ENTVE|nr:unnamed protein product [Enterobius vermicularis]